MAWTTEQQKAIDARGEQVLVSAAAGSGKTSVLTERVKNILCDTENKCSVNEILVVTFTKAAAGEMRTRIAEAIKKEIKAVNSGYLKGQLTLLPTADICTIDSFCARIVKENFNLCDIEADYNMLTDGEEKTLLNQCISEVTEGQYEKEDEAFKLLNKMFLTERDDSELSNVILSLYKFSRSYPNPEVWLNEIVSYYENDISDTPWVNVMCDYFSLLFSYHLGKLNRAAYLMKKDGNFKDDYVAYFDFLCEKIHEYISMCENKEWDNIVNSFKNFGKRVFRYQHKTANEKIKEFAKTALSDFGDDMKKIAEKELPTSSEHNEDKIILLPVVKKLCAVTTELSVKLNGKKKELNKYGFDDILHKCIDVLVRFDGKNFTPTETALNLRNKYKEILIDEYQDTNEAQNIIFEAISKNMSNFYCVGDVKQSIYRFRLASPELFMNLKKKLPEYNGTLMPSQINLNANFRSREGVTKAVNFAFSRLMSENAGDIDYNTKEYLNYGATFSENNDADCEIHYISAPELLSKEATEVEAEKIAKYIKDFVASNKTVFDKNLGEERKYNYGDFCILLRSMKNKSNVYEEYLKKENIPVFCETDKSVETSKELNYLLSLFKTVCNPLLEVPLVAVTMSPVFGFSADELAEIRLENKKANLYSCLLSFQNKSKKTKDFIKKLDLYRNISATYTVEDFVRFVIEDTGIKDICLAMPNSNERIGVVKGIEETAAQFTKDKKSGLSSYVRYLDDLIENGGLVKYTAVNAGENSVKIMSVHKSKGLEFPCVILADNFKKFNKQDSYGAMTVSRETGIGLKIRDDEKYTQYGTLSSAATETSVLRGELSEELRVLYVAMTRAREKLVMFLTDTSKKTLSKVNNFLMSSSDIVNCKVSPYLVYSSNSVGEWILYAFSLHSDCEQLRILSGMNTLVVPQSDFKVDFITEDISEQTEEANEDEAPDEKTDEALYEKIKEKISYRYIYDDLNGIKSKRTASSLGEKSERKEYFASSKPKFLNNALTGTNRGNAFHKFLEKCDFNKAVVSVKDEISRLLDLKVLSQEEADIIDEASVEKFLCSDIGKRLLKSENVYKEFEFSVLRKIKEIYPDVSDEFSNEEIVVEGKIDCAFIENKKGIIIDYKTDNIQNESDLINEYKGQLLVYASAFEECTETKVTELYLYSFKMNKFIKVSE